MSVQTKLLVALLRSRVAWFAAAGTIDAVEADALWRELRADFTAYR